MKTGLLAALVGCVCLAGCHSTSQTQLPGAYGFNWGDSPATVQAGLVRDGWNLTGETSAADKIHVLGGTVNGYPATATTFRFLGGRLFQIMTLYSHIPDANLIGQERQMYASLKSKYGEPLQDLYRIGAPYQEGDGKEAAAFRADKAVCFAGWGLDKGSHYVVITITHYANIKLQYGDTAAEDALDQAKKDAQ